MERGDPLFALKEERTRLKHVSLVNTRTSFWKKKKITIERGDPLFALKEGLVHQFAIEKDETESEVSLGSRSFLHRVNDQVRKRTVIWECSCLQHCKHLYSWRRIAQTIGIPSKIQKISQ